MGTRFAWPHLVDGVDAGQYSHPLQYSIPGGGIPNRRDGIRRGDPADRRRRDPCGDDSSTPPRACAPGTAAT